MPFRNRISRSSSGGEGLSRLQQSLRGALRGASFQYATLGIFAIIPLVFLLIFFFYPVFSLVSLGFKPEGNWNIQALWQTFGSARVWRIIRQTLLQGLGGALGSLILGVPGAYVLYRCKFPGQRIIRALVAVPFVMPSVVVGTAFRVILSQEGWFGFLHLEGTFWAILLACVFFNYSVVVRMVGNVWASLDSKQTEAAKTLGAKPIRVFFTVTLPQLGSAMAASFTLVFLYCSTAYGIMQIMAGPGYGTIETEIWYQTTQIINLPVASIISVLQLLIAGACLYLSNVWQRRSEKTSRLNLRVEQRLQKSDWPMALITLFVVATILITPILFLFYRSFQDAKGNFSLVNYVNLFQNKPGSGLRVPVSQALWNSLEIALQATLLTLFIGVLISLAIGPRIQNHRWFSSGIRFYEAMVILPLGVSSVTLGFGFLITLDKPPIDIRNSALLIPIAQSIVAIPLVIKLMVPVIRAIDPKMREAASIIGATPLRVRMTLDFPYLLRGIGVAIGMAMAISLGEFGATSFLSRPERPTLPVMIYTLFGHLQKSNYGMAIAGSAVIALLTAVIMGIGEIVQPKQISNRAVSVRLAKINKADLYKVDLPKSRLDPGSEF